MVDMMNFITEIIDEHNKNNRFDNRVHTRFPPEPNGYLHIGHAKSICLNFGIALKYNGKCNLRFDDTNPSKEEIEYVESIKEDVRWLGFDWEDRMFFASDYFQIMYELAEKLILKGKAYVCHLTNEQMREYRGTLTIAGKESPYRNRPISENLELFRQMAAGKFEEGYCVLRAKIDMSSPNLNLRDPVIYRIKKVSHHRTGDNWKIYPMYDFAHCISDSIERITHSICTLEFENNRPLYDWFLQELELYHPQQIEFARLNLSYTVLSKRKLLELVNTKVVNGWDDPRMPTIAGLRNRGYTPSAIREFCNKIGVAKVNSVIDISVLESTQRDELNYTAPRIMAVLKPLKITIVNYPENQTEEFEIPNHPDRPELGVRKVLFSKHLFIEADDFQETPEKKFFMLFIGNEVRLRGAYFIKCISFLKDNQAGEITELFCEYDKTTRGGNAADGRKVKSTIHWIAAENAVDLTVNLYDHLFKTPLPENTDENTDYKNFLNPESYIKLTNCKIESYAMTKQIGDRLQFERLGYFFLIDKNEISNTLVFNRIVKLKDTWAKINQR